MTEKLYFDEIKEKDGLCLVEYGPPAFGQQFATLSITYIENVATDEVIRNMEKQAYLWLSRYPIALMVSAFDKSGDLISLTGVKESNHLTVAMRDGEFESYWRLLKNNEFPKENLDQKYLVSVYKDVGYRTQSGITESVKKDAKYKRLLNKMFLIWAVFIPALIAIVEFFSPTWLAFIALAYSFWKALQQWLVMTRRKEKSAKDIMEEQEELRKAHHHFHCEQNPEAFEHLKMENFQRSEREAIKNDFDSL